MLLRGKFVVCVTLPATASCSDFCSLVWGVLLCTSQHMSIPIETSGCTSCSVLADQLLFDDGGFQIVGASSFYIYTGPQNFLDVYPTIMQVLHAVPISMDRTTTVLVLQFQICSGIHPPLSIHHMLVALLLQLLCNTVI